MQDWFLYFLPTFGKITVKILVLWGEFGRANSSSSSSIETVVVVVVVAAAAAAAAA